MLDNPYANWSLAQVKEQRKYLQGYIAALEDAIRCLPKALENTKVHEQLQVTRQQLDLLYQRYLAIIAERRERRRKALIAKTGEER